MTWDVNFFQTLSRKENGGTVTFGDDSKGKIIGVGNVKFGNSPLIENVSLIDGLKHNLLSISQLCDKGFKVVFDSSCCRVLDKDNSCVFVGNRENNVYTIDMNDFISNISCLSALNEDSWLWHRRLGHASFDHLSRIGSKGIIKGIPNIKFIKDRICDACQFGNKSSSPLRLLRMSLLLVL